MKESEGRLFLGAVCFFASLFLLCCCSNGSSGGDDDSCSDYRAAMRNFVIRIADTARVRNPNFIVIPQNGQGVAWDDDDDPESTLNTAYLQKISGSGREDTFYGCNSSYDIADDTLTYSAISQEYQYMCDIYKAHNVTILSTDYCSIPDNVTDSYARNSARHYISFAAPERDLSVIPSSLNDSGTNYYPYHENTENITSLSAARNFLYLINPENYQSRSAFVTALATTNYDVLIIDLWCGNEMLTSADLHTLKRKSNGASRLVICYMSIGEAENYRYYWHSGWRPGSPSFICALNPDWPGNYKVRYWNEDWQNIIVNGSESYLSKIINAGFDGVYLDIIDAYEFFEENE